MSGLVGHESDGHSAGRGLEDHSAEELTSATASGLRWFAMSRFGTEVLLMFAMVVLARLVSPAEFGAFAIALIVFQIATSVPAEGIGSALVQRREVTREHLQAGVALTLIVMSAAGLLTLLLSYVVVAPLCGEEAASLVRLSCPLFLLQALATVPMAILRRQLDFRRLSIIELASSAARSFVSLGLVVFAGMGGSGMVIGVLAGGLCTAALALASARAPLPRLRLAAARDLAGYGVPASVAAVAWTGFANGDYAVLAARLGTAAAGMYWRAYTLGVDYQRKASVVMNTLAFPVLARSRDDADFSSLRRRMVRLLTVVLFPLLTGLAITAPIVIPGVFGPAWEQAVVPTQLLAAGGAACLVIDAVGSALMAAGRARGLLGYGVAHFIVYIGSVVVVAPLGIDAVALDAAIVHSLFVVVAYAMLVRRTGEGTLACLWRDLAPATVSCVVLAVLAVPVDGLTQVANLAQPVRFLAIALAAAFGYLLTLRIGFGESWSDLGALTRRLLPVDRLAGVAHSRRRRGAVASVVEIEQSRA